MEVPLKSNVVGFPKRLEVAPLPCTRCGMPARLSECEIVPVSTYGHREYRLYECTTCKAASPLIVHVTDDAA